MKTMHRKFYGFNLNWIMRFDEVFDRYMMRYMTTLCFVFGLKILNRMITISAKTVRTKSSKTLIKSLAPFVMLFTHPTIKNITRKRVQRTNSFYSIVDSYFICWWTIFYYTFFMAHVGIDFFLKSSRFPCMKVSWL